MSAARSPLRVGLLGYGLAGRVFHAPLITATPGLTLAAVVTSNAERRARIGADHPDVTVVDTEAQLLADPGSLDLVVVAAPNRFHAPLALAAIAAHVPVMVDKPIAPTSADARRIIDEAARQRVPLTVFQNRRWDGDYLTVRRLMAEGVLGRVFRFESRFERWRPQVGTGWREAPEPEEAGGQMYDLGAHLVDQALQLFGPATHVYAEMDVRRSGARVDDDAFVALTHASGTRSHLFMSAAAAQLGPRMRVLGEKAGYTKFGLDGQEDALAAGGHPNSDGWGEDPAEQWGLVGTEGDAKPLRTERGRYQDLYAGVAASLRDGTPMPVDPRDSLTVLEVLEAARRSAETGTVVAFKRGS